ncbi:MAG: hypothetical protein A2Y87_03665 [Bacteroidetes bacterium RBG_13_46_8]|nr:MAG: hypothetical protein A2Y87_03665 [Bacteroidetes bacterium RBG_13_46_8]
MKRKLLCICFAGLVMMLLIACRPDQPDRQMTSSGFSVSVERFDQDLFSGDPAKMDSIIPFLQNRYGLFFELFTRRIIAIGDTGTPGFKSRLQSFVTNYDNYSAYRKVQQLYPGPGNLEKKLTEAFRHYLQYFPDKKVPRIVAFVSGFNYSVVSDSGLLGIGLDKYLGPEEEYYRRYGIYNYLRVNMHADKIPSDCMRLWAETEYAYNDSVNNLLSRMIYEGKVMFFVRAMLPDDPDSLLWGFSGPQMNFCIRNEKQMWTYLVEYKQLFLTDRFTIDKFTLEGPFTSGFSPESPGRAAVWIGYRIVEKYMKKHKNLSLEALMKEDDYQKILTLSGYNP